MALASPTRPAKRPHDDDTPPGLPPLDGDGDEPAADPELLEDEETPKDDGGDPFDDATGEGELAALDDEGLDESASVLDAEEADGLDVGAPDVLGDESDLLTGDDAHEVPHDEDYGLNDDASTTALDAGEEGPSATEEGLTGEGLPPLVADDDEAREDAEAFFDDDFARSGGDAWSSLWERFGPPLALAPVRALARLTDGVLSAGRELVRIDLEGATERTAGRGLRGDVTRVVTAGGAVFATTDGGGLLVSRDAGATFSDANAWRAHLHPEEAAAGLDVVGSASGVVWGRTAQGTLLSSADGTQWEKADVDGFVRAVGGDDEGVVVLVRGLAVSEVLRRTGDGWSRTEIPGDLIGPGAASIVARGRTIAIAVEGAGVLRSLGGGPWSRLAGTEAATVVAILDDAGTLVVARGGDGDAESSLLRIGADGEGRVVAVWEERADGEAGVSAIAVDEAHQVVWVGGGFGVAAFQPRIRGAR